MSEQAIPVGSTGLSLRSEEQTTSAGVVQSEAVIIVDPTTVANKLAVDSSGRLTANVVQPTHDNLNLNANLQVANADVSATNAVFVRGTAADGAAATANPVQIAGKTAAGTLQTLTTDDDGELIIHQKSANIAYADGISNTRASPVSEDETSFIFYPTYSFLYNGTTWDRIRGDATNGLLVNLGANNDVTVTSGSITETNSAAIAASLSVMDDWDETDRAKVNPIVGQAGVAAGAGAVGASTQRVTLASDDPLVAKTPDLTGTFGYATGTLAGAGNVTGSGACIGIRVFASGADGTFNIGGGSTITVRSGTGVDINPMGQISNAVVNWVSGTLDVLVTSLS